MAKSGSGPIEPLTPAQVARRLKARGLKTSSPAELEQLTRMMNEELALKAQSDSADHFQATVLGKAKRR